MNTKKWLLKSTNRNLQRWFIENLVMLIIFVLITLVAVMFSR